MAPEVVTRFAPSPTGHLHVGGARTALFCWAFARKHRGSFLLRIEDTDQARSSDESARGIMEDLAWLGIDWDEGPVLDLPGRRIGGDPRGVGPFFQARRIALYDQFVRQLVEQGRAYPAFESSEELEAKRRAAVAAKKTYRYDRQALRDVPDVRDRVRRMESGEAHVVRFLAPQERIVVADEVLGDVSYAAGEMDDFVIRKADGLPTYHFAVVVDDESMGVTHVLRAQEHLNNTPRHVALQRALSFRTPAYAHMPLICNMDGSKMSKRDKAKVARQALKDALAKDRTLSPGTLASELARAGERADEPAIASFLAGDNDSLDTAEALARRFGATLPEIEVCDFRRAGYAPEAICNFLALLGWNPGVKTPDGKDLEKFDNAYLAAHFSIERIGKTSSKFDRKKLAAFNGEYLGSLGDDEFLARWRRWIEVERLADAAPQSGEAPSAALPPALAHALADPRRRAWLLAAIKPRARTLADASRACEFLGEPRFQHDAVAKHLDGADSQGRQLVGDFLGVLRCLEPFEPKPIHDALEAFAKDRALPNAGPIAQAIRVAITGGTVSPGVAEMLAILGREESLARLARVAAGR